MFTYWFILGLILIFSEFLLPGFIIIFFGFGAWVVALGYYFNLITSIPIALTIFSLSSLALLFFLRHYFAAWFIGDSSSDSDPIEEEFLGKEVTILRVLDEGRYKVEYKGASWNARSSTTFTVGQCARITQREGLLFVLSEL